MGSLPSCKSCLTLFTFLQALFFGVAEESRAEPNVQEISALLEIILFGEFTNSEPELSQSFANFNFVYLV